MMSVATALLTVITLWLPSLNHQPDQPVEHPGTALAQPGSTDSASHRAGVSIERDLVYATRPSSPANLTSLDIYAPSSKPGDELRPVLVFIHGGSWSFGDKKGVQFKPAWAVDQGWVFVSINYRLSPAVMHPEHARDAAAALAYIRARAHEWGGDPKQIAVMGHSAGAHLAAIVACEESLLAEVGMTTHELSAVVLLDGAGYNLPERIPALPPRGMAYRWFTNAFGDDPALWTIASPTLQAQPGDQLPPLLCIHAGDREVSRIEGGGVG